MPLYRCYFLDDADKIAEVETIDAPGLAMAIERARQLLRSDKRFTRFRGIEIWQDATRVFTDAAH